MITDPVCGMAVDPRTAQHRLKLGGTTYYFCSAGCLEKFRADPDRYLNPPATDPAVITLAMGALAGAAEGTIWTCPMHPQIRRDGPGQLPDLRHGARAARTDRSTKRPNPELIDMSRRFWVSAALTLPLVVLAMATELLGTGAAADARSRVWVQLALATPVVLWGGWPFFERCWASLKTRNLNMFTLIGLGVGVAYGYSLVATLAPQIFPASLRGPWAAWSRSISRRRR